ncbi:MAG: phosphate ABC transporter substrate-binding protein PstS [Syntrophobacteraceae bacterium]|nr:phosphate ABC transporter substrate-binding protein PstS [Syntrophobacteraceae bacterium]
MRSFGQTLTMCAVMWLGLSTVAVAADITAAGASFPYPLFAKWAVAYRNATGIRVNYRSIGSGGAISQLKAGTIDFGASEMPFTPEELQRAGLLQFPSVIGGVIPVVNLGGVKPAQIKLSGRVLADIYLGKITKWNSPEIAGLNEGVKLPDKFISVVHRADASGTTFTFSNYLSRVSPQWKRAVGTGVSVAWPTGVGGKGNEGVAAYVQKISGSIGYVEYAYVLQNNMTYALVQNRAGRFVKPGLQSFQAASADTNWVSAKDFYMVLTDRPGSDAWPIVGVTFILMHSVQKDPHIAKTALDFLQWTYRNGGELANRLGYVLMPSSVVELINKEWRSEITGPGGKPILFGD